MSGGNEHLDTMLGYMMATLRSIAASELEGEAAYTITDRHVKKAPNHTEQYVSSGQR